MTQRDESVLIVVGLVVALAVLVWRVRLLRALVFGLAAGAILAVGST